MNKIDRQPLKRHGGKSYLADRIIALMPPRARNSNAPAADDPGYVHYVEPYFGGGAVLLANDPQGISEVVNDIDGQLTEFWEALKYPDSFRLLYQQLLLTPCSQAEFHRAGANIGRNALDRAIAFFIRNRQSRQALSKDFATLSRNRTRRGMNELPAAWLSAIEGLPEVHRRLQRVVILNDEAVKVIRQQDGPRTLFYCDPPYAHETRTVTDAYAHEMNEDQHKVMLTALGDCVGRFVLSGYHSPLYDEWASRRECRCVEIEIPNHAGGGAAKRKMIECLWMNYSEDGRRL